MARNVITSLVDDIDGTEATDTIEFSFAGLDYEIDLSESHVNELHELLNPFVEAARTVRKAAVPVKATRTRAAKGEAKPDPDKARNAAIREWGAANGWEVNSRGRVKKELIEAYDAHCAAQDVAPTAPVEVVNVAESTSLEPVFAGA